MNDFCTSNLVRRLRFTEPEYVRVCAGNKYGSKMSAIVGAAVKN